MTPKPVTLKDFTKAIDKEYNSKWQKEVDYTPQKQKKVVKKVVNRLYY